MPRERCARRCRSARRSVATRSHPRTSISTERYVRRSEPVLQAFDEHDLRVAGSVEILERTFHAVVAAAVERARRLVHRSPRSLDIEAFAPSCANVLFDRIDEQAPDTGTLRVRAHSDPVEIPAPVGHLDRTVAR